MSAKKHDKLLSSSFCLNK